MAQAYLPNPNRPPLYCDFLVELKDGELALHVENAGRLKAHFLLDELLPAHADNLRRMRGIKFDWGRYDQNHDHVFSNQAFTRKLEELGIEHEAEEYRGNTWDRNWTEYGRVYADLLPFFARHLAFETVNWGDDGLPLCRALRNGSKKREGTTPPSIPKAFTWPLLPADVSIA